MRPYQDTIAPHITGVEGLSQHIASLRHLRGPDAADTSGYSRADESRIQPTTNDTARVVFQQDLVRHDL